MHFGEVKVQTKDGQHAFEIQVSLEDLDPESVRVQLCADSVGGAGALREDMRMTGPVAGLAGQYVYRGSVSAARPPAKYENLEVLHAYTLLRIAIDTSTADVSCLTL